MKGFSVYTLAVAGFVFSVPLFVYAALVCCFYWLFQDLTRGD